MKTEEEIQERCKELRMIVDDRFVTEEELKELKTLQWVLEE